ncbi:MAG: membrane dipeptidase [Phycisphaerales bacterium]
MTTAPRRHGAGPRGTPSATRWIADGHLDLAYLALSGRDLTAPRADDDRGCVTLPALARGGVRLAFATIFTELGGDPATNPVAYRESADAAAAEAAGLRQLECYEALERAGHLRIVRSDEDLPASMATTIGASPVPGEAAREADALRIVILMEGADPIRDAGCAARWVARGVRAVGLSWALGSRFAGGNGAPGPLTGAGRELVAALDELGVVHDASHLSDEGFDELLALARGRIMASHSNCRALAGESQRHLADDQIRAIGARGGVVGLNLFGKFLVTGRRATIDDCVAHVERAASIMGHRRGVALGSDMDGGFGPSDLPAGLDAPERLPALVDALQARGWSDAECAGFAHGNWLRFMQGAA